MAMMIYNTLTRDKEPFSPVKEGEVGIYLCGPTVYKPSHIGHAVGPVIFDAIRRWLEFRGYKVNMVSNITDVDDKIILEANRQGKTMKEVADAVTADYYAAMDKLNVRKPNFAPKATEFIPEIIDMIQTLIAKGFAYVAGGDVYYDVTKFPGYGKLSNRSTEEQEAHTRELQSSDEKRHSWDFALWKSAKPEEPSWDSPWGQGRPGWHIECSAMSLKILGETFDIHGGGMDLIFPHHENEIAQSEAATGKPFVKYWMHNGLTRVNTKKMSKSLGNVRQLSDLLSQHTGETIRFFILSTHYRRPIDFSDEEIVKVSKGLQTFYRLFDRVKQITGFDVYKYQPEPKPFQFVSDEQKIYQDIMSNSSFRNEKWHKYVEMIWVTHLEFDKDMDNDFNTAQAISELFTISSCCNSLIDLYENPDQKDILNKLIVNGSILLIQKARLLGLFEHAPESKLTDTLTEGLMKLLIDVRAEARKQKQFALSDMVRDRLKDIGVQLKDGKDGTTWEKTL